MATVALSKVPVKSIEESRVDEGTRPDHTRRPNNKLAKNATKRKTEDLARKTNKDLVSISDRLPVKYLLRYKNVGRVGTSNDNISHHGDTDVFLDGEWAGIERPDIAEGIKSRGGKNPFHALPQWERKQLRNDAGDEDGGICSGV